MKKLLAGVLIYALTVSQVFGQAALLPNAKQTFLDAVGNPLVGGSVTFYVPGSTNKKTTWLDSAQTSSNTNPVTLDAAGRAVIFGQGVYRQVVKDANGNTIWDAPTTAYGSSQPSGATGTDTAPVGSVIQWSSFTPPTNWQWANGQALSRNDFPDLLAAITISGAGVSCTSGSPTLGGWSDTSQMGVGAHVEASCIPTGSTIVAIPSSSTITISNNATATAVATATVFPWGNGNGVDTFNVPDLRGRVPAGSDAMGGTTADRFQAVGNLTTVSGSATALAATGTTVYAGQVINAAGVPAGTTVSAVRNSTTTTLVTTGGSTTATVGSSNGLVVGQTIASAFVTHGTTIASISGTTITMSAAAITPTTIGVPTSGITAITVQSVRGIAAGMGMSGTGIASGATVSSVSATGTITMSASASASRTSSTITFTGATTALPVTFSGAAGIPIVMSANATSSATVSAVFQAFAGANAPAASGGSQSRTSTLAEAPIGQYGLFDYGQAYTITADNNGVSGLAVGSTGFDAAAGRAGSGLPIGITDYNITSGVNIFDNAGGAAHGVLQPTVTINYIIKVKANSTGAGGVLSWGGLFGDIATDATLQAYVSGGVNFAGIANASNQTFLANISGGIAQPTPTTWSAWMDAVCGSAQGNIVFRGASSWSCLAPGTNGFVLSTTGAASDPVWVSAPTVTPQSANTVYAGPTSGSANNPSFRALVGADLPGTFSGFANPSASIGLTAKNGTATTAMRSDAAPALDQSIAPTWTGQHTFSLVPVFPSQTAHFVWAAPSGASGAPSFRALVGSDLPNPSASSLGGVQSYAAVSHQWINTISTSGVPSSSQPAASDLSNGTTGSGAVVLATAPTVTLPNATGLPISTGVSGLGTGIATFLGTPSFSNLSAAVTGGTISQTIASGTKALTTTAIASASCTAAQTVTATGTATTDTVTASFNGDPTAVTGFVPLTTGMLTIIAYPTANAVNFKECNNTASSITPGAITLNWRVAR